MTKEITEKAEKHLEVLMDTSMNIKKHGKNGFVGLQMIKQGSLQSIH